jgi:hypothetical protein
LYFINHLYALQNDLNHCLSIQNLRKFQIRCRLYQLILLKVSRIPLVVMFSGIQLVAILYYAVYEPKSNNNSLIILLIWFPFHCFWAWIQNSLVVITGGILYITIYYVKLRFRQITEQIKISMAKSKISKHFLKKILLAHNNLTIITNDYNKIFNYFMATVYIVATVNLNLLFYLSFYAKMHVFIRINIFIVAMTGVLLIYLATYTSAILSKEAHITYNSFNSIIIRTQLPINIRLKV